MYSMNYIGKFISNFRDFYNEINAATLTGAIDVVVVEQPDGSYTCSPFHVRFGKLGVLRSREKVVDIEINGEPLDIHMKLGESGEAFFVEEVSPSELGDDDYIPPHLACSPIPQDSYLQNFHTQNTSRATLAEITDEKGVNEGDSREGSMESDLLSSQEVSRESSILKDDAALGSNSAVKMFTPETVTFEEDRTRRLSVTVAEFRPIEAKEVAEDIQNTCSDIVSVRKDSTKENTEDGSKQSSSGNKRKRRRKSLLKKKGNSQKKNGNGSYNTHVEPSESVDSIAKTVNADVKKPLVEKQDQEIIFQIEDLSEKPEEPYISKKERNIRALASLGLSPASSEPCLHPETARELSRMQHASTESDFHFFSDTEVTPGCSRDIEGRRIPTALSDTAFEVLTTLGHLQNSRPPSPVQSDTEYEINRQSKVVGVAEDDEPEKSALSIQQSWRWGELPSPPKRPLMPSQQSRNSISKLETNEPEPISSSDEETTKKQEEAAAAAAEAEAHRSMLSGMFSFMKKTKRIRHNPESEGIYLSDLNSEELDPEVAALYFPTSYRQGSGGREAPLSTGAVARDEEDAESGNGTSLPQSPHSVEGAIGGPKSLDSDFEEPKHSIFEKKSYGEISMSLCGGLTGPDGTAPSEDNFLQSIVTYDDLVRNPKLVENPALVVRFNGKYYNWRTACPLIMSLVIYQKPLPQELVETLSTEYMTKDGQKKAGGEQEATGRGYSWWYWRRTSEPKKLSSDAAPASDSASSPESEKLADVKEVETKIEKKVESVSEGANPMEANVDIPVRPTGFDSNIIQEHDDLAIATQASFPSSPDDQKDAKEEGYSGSNSSDESDGGRRKSQSIKIPIQRRSYYEHTEKYRKTLRLSSDQIASLNLNDGANEVVFSVTTAYQGTSRCKCHIYKWRYDDKIVISDIDGTITKSDVLGHILPIVGKDWAQSGVAQLFTKIKNNGYKLLYLSARAIGQARVTRDYLRSIKQGDLSLPDGPLLLNPTSLISAFHREVIEKKPEEFKISCLRDIQALFPSSCKPFYAGYGNKINDVWAYRAVGIPIFRIFTINHRGELKHELTQTFQSSYSNMSSIVDQMFPPPPEDASEDFSNFVYWRDPIPEIEIDPQLSCPEKTSLSGGEKRKSVKGSA